MKKLLFAVLILAFTLPSCEKEDDLSPLKTEENKPTNAGGDTGGDTGGGSQAPTTLDLLTSNWWLMKNVRLNGTPITSNGSEIFDWTRNGIHRDNPDGNGNWAHSGTYTFTNNDSTSFTMFTGQTNENLWYITKLNADTMMIDYTNPNMGLFQFIFVPTN